MKKTLFTIICVAATACTSNAPKTEEVKEAATTDKKVETTTKGAAEAPIAESEKVVKNGFTIVKKTLPFGVDELKKAWFKAFSDDELLGAMEVEENPTAYLLLDLDNDGVMEVLVKGDDAAALFTYKDGKLQTFDTESVDSETSIMYTGTGALMMLAPGYILQTHGLYGGRNDVFEAYYKLENGKITKHGVHDWARDEDSHNYSIDEKEVTETDLYKTFPSLDNYTSVFKFTDWTEIK